ncbi:hypothetical protein GGI35DRAFT_320120 [Trichoderma velutinum]
MAGIWRCEDLRESPGDFCSMDFHSLGSLWAGQNSEYPGLSDWISGRHLRRRAENCEESWGGEIAAAFGVGEFERPEFVAAKPRLGGGWRGRKCRSVCLSRAGHGDGSRILGERVSAARGFGWIDDRFGFCFCFLVLCFCACSRFCFCFLYLATGYHEMRRERDQVKASNAVRKSRIMTRDNRTSHGKQDCSSGRRSSQI